MEKGVNIGRIQGSLLNLVKDQGFKHGFTETKDTKEGTEKESPSKEKKEGGKIVKFELNNEQQRRSMPKAQEESDDKSDVSHYTGFLFFKQDPLKASTEKSKKETNPEPQPIDQQRRNSRGGSPQVHSKKRLDEISRRNSVSPDPSKLTRSPLGLQMQKIGLQIGENTGAKLNQFIIVGKTNFDSSAKRQEGSIIKNSDQIDKKAVDPKKPSSPNEDVMSEDKKNLNDQLVLGPDQYPVTPVVQKKKKPQKASGILFNGSSDPKDP
jgi:hypothetical protein